MNMDTFDYSHRIQNLYTNEATLLGHSTAISHSSGSKTSMEINSRYSSIKLTHQNDTLLISSI